MNRQQASEVWMAYQRLLFTAVRSALSIKRDMKRGALPICSVRQMNPIRDSTYSSRLKENTVI